ncbi:hypothetical protein D3C76_606320 [compost metagenome]
MGLHPVRRDHRAQAVERAADDVPRRHPVPRQLESTVAETGHVEQVLDVAVEALRFVAGAFQQFAAILRRDRLAEGQQAVDRPAHGGKRRAQVVADRGEQGAAQLFGFAMQAGGLQVLRQLRAGQRLGQRLAERGEQAATLAIQRPGIQRTHAEQRQRPLLRRQRQPPPGAARQGAGAQPRRLVVLPGPVGGGALLLGELALHAGLDLPLAVGMAEQTDFQVRAVAQLLRGGGHHRLAVGGGGELARQVEELAGFLLGIAQGLQLPALAGGQVAGEAGHEEEEQQGQHVLLALDGQGEMRRDEQEVVGDERQHRADQRRPLAAAHRHQQHGGEEHQGNVRQLQQVRHAPGQRTGARRGHQRQQVVEMRRLLAYARGWRIRPGVAVQHADFQPCAQTQQTRRQTAAEQPAIPALPGAPHQQQAGAAFAGMLDQRTRHLAATQLHHFPAETLGQLLGILQAKTGLLVTRRTGLDVDQAPRQVPALRHPTGMAHQSLAVAAAVHADQKAPAQRRGLAALLAVTARQVGIHPRGSSLHRQLAQRGEVGLAEEGVDSRARLFRHVDLAFAQTLQQLARRQVDQQQLVGLLQHPVRHRLAHLHAGDVAHLVVEAFQVLDVDRGVDVDAGGKQLLDVLPALGMAAARCVAVRQFVDQRQLRRIGEQAVEIHFREADAAILGTQQRLLRQPGEQRLGLGATVGLDDTDAQGHTLAQLALGGEQHGVGLAHPGRGAEEHLETAATVARQVGKQGIGALRVSHAQLLFAIDGILVQSGQSHVQRQHIHHRRPHQRPLGMRLDQPLQAGGRQLARGGDARHLVQRGGRRQLRVESAGGSGHQRLRHRLPVHRFGGGIPGDPRGQCRVARREVAGSAGDGGEIAGRGARVEPFGAFELLRDQRGTTNLALLVTDQAAVGLLVESHLGDGGDRQRVGDAGDQGEHRQGTEGGTDVFEHGVSPFGNGCGATLTPALSRRERGLSVPTGHCTRPLE